VYVLDQEIGRCQQDAPRGRLEHGAVVADSDPDRGRPPGRPPDDLDQASLGCSCRPIHPERKFLRSCFPSIVKIDSGWNWTPSTGSRRWRRPMISPSSAHAVISSASGIVSRMTASEWYRVATKGLPSPANSPRPACLIAEVLPCIWVLARATVAPYAWPID